MLQFETVTTAAKYLNIYFYNHLYFRSCTYTLKIYIFQLKFTAMVCGNMEVEATPETFMDDLYDNKEEKVIKNEWLLPLFVVILNTF